MRPDRVIVNSINEAVIIDYKTGNENPNHLMQMQTYYEVLVDMNFKVIKKILVYINNGIQIKEF